MVDLREKPYYLNEKDIQWVKETIEDMTIEEKISQLFFNLFTDMDLEKNREFLKKYPVGGARYISRTSKEVYELIKDLQENSKIPMIIAANCDAGGNGATLDGTYIASAAQVEASRNEKTAYDAGYVSGREARALGINVNFGPCVDIIYNWRNTIINTRSYGTNPEDVLKYSSSYIKGIEESKIHSCIKHFPGDGTEERDQHLLMGVNEMDPEEWDETFGKVYSSLVDRGVGMIMAGHICMPKYQKKLNPKLKDEEILPATISPELIDGLLKDKIGFNGVVVTDASHMIGMAAAMKRRDYVPASIAAGCDMFLFFNDHEEDYNFMLEGYKNGVITEERLQDALERILGLKAAMKLHIKQQAKEDNLVGRLDVIGCKEHLDLAEEAADKAITLVKNKWKELPIRPETHRRIKLHTLFGEMGGVTNGSRNSEKIFIEELERVGFEVTLHDGSTNKKGKTAEYSEQWDAAIVMADIQGYAAENNYRIRWKSHCSSDIPWYIHELPTVFVSLNFTTHLIDVPMVKTYINSYKNTRTVIRKTIEKIIGDSEFLGQANENVWCDKWDTKL